MVPLKTGSDRVTALAGPTTSPVGSATLVTVEPLRTSTWPSTTPAMVSVVGPVVSSSPRATDTVGFG